MVPEDRGGDALRYFNNWDAGNHDTGQQIDAVTWLGDNESGTLFDAGLFGRADDDLSIEVRRTGLYRVQYTQVVDSLATGTSVRPDITSVNTGLFCNGPSLLNISWGWGAGTGNVESGMPAPWQDQKLDVVWIEEGDSIACAAYAECNTDGFTAPKVHQSGSLFVVALA